jgi:hypothetical protein
VRIMICKIMRVSVDVCCYSDLNESLLVRIMICKIMRVSVGESYIIHI